MERVSKASLGQKTLTGLNSCLVFLWPSWKTQMRGLLVALRSVYLVKPIIKREVGSWAPKLERARGQGCSSALLRDSLVTPLPTKIGACQSLNN